MADYRSSLTGTQMDSALLDMAEHNSEAYAVGERNGIAVASDDVTYHNNARYYAQIASSQIVGDASSAVRWDTDQSEVLTDAQKAVARNNIDAASDSDVVKITSQTLTTAQQSQARANIGAGSTNPNLLDNPWFTVRQRGNGPFTSGYTVDRWKVSGGTPTITPRSPYGINISASSAFAFDEFTGMDSAALLGKTVTLSALIGGVVYSGTGTYTSSTSINISVQAGGIYVRLVYDANHPQIRIYGAGTNNVDLDAVKLELGSVSTLANDAPPNYAEELAKCQYRCVVYDLPTNTLLCRGIATSSTNIAGVIDLPRSMAEDKTPTVSLTGSLTTPAGNTITAVTAATYARKNKLRVNFTGTGFSGGTVYDIFTGSSTPKIVISADL